MRGHGRWSISRLIVLLIVLQAHLLVIVLFAQTKAGARAVRVAEPVRGILLPIDLTPPDEQQHPKTTVLARTSLPPAPTINIPPPAIPAESVPVDPPVDWSREAEEVIRLQAGEGQQSRARTMGDRGDSSNPMCKMQPEFQWNPEPKRVGFSGGLPYVRFGKRCVVGLGFFGCAIGKLPEGNAHLFDHMRDPHLEKGSVPEIDCVP